MPRAAREWPFAKGVPALRFAGRTSKEKAMSEHSAVVRWQRTDDAFASGRYSRRHEWRFDGGAVVAASASPAAVRAPWSDPAGVDPEEAFVAAISSCHMLWFLSLAASGGFVVDRYEDEAVGHMGRIADGRDAITEVTLHPRIDFGGHRRPEREEIEALHEAAHARCFIANSVTSNIRIETPA
jgi:organic hydroperoxide reductase OsmC/OhrA